MGYALPPTKRPNHLHGGTLTHFGFDDSTEGRRAFIRRLDGIAAAEAEVERASEESNEPNPLDRLADLSERGRVHGSETFRDLVRGAFAADPKKAKDRARAATNSNYLSSELGKAFTEAEAGLLIAEGLEHLGLDEAALRKTPRATGAMWRSPGRSANAPPPGRN